MSQKEQQNPAPSPEQPALAPDSDFLFAQSARNARDKENGKLPPPGSRGYNIYLLKRCLTYFIPYKIFILISFAALILVSLAEAATAYIVKPAMDDIFLNKDRTALYLVPLAFVIITTGKGAGRVLQNYMMQYCGLKVLEKLRDELYNKIIKLPLRYYEGAQVGQLMARIINDVAMIRSSLPSVVMIIRQLLTMIGLMGVVFYQNFELALVATVALPLAFFPFIHYGRKLRRLGRHGQAIYADASVLLNEILSGIRVVKAFSTEKEEGERFDQENRRLLNISIKQVLAGESSSAVMELVGAVGIGLVLFIGGLQVIEGTSTPGTFMSFMAALALLYEPIKKLNSANNEIQRALAGAERVFDILDSKENVEEEDGTVELPLPSPRMELRFEHVCFAYNRESVALRDINLDISHGERLAIVGPSGAGKTTFINLLPRFYDPTEGRITLNGLDLRAYTLSSLRGNISIVSQDNFLFNCSIRENIAYGQPDFSEEQVTAAARAAYAHEFIMSLPEAYATVIGERGVRLSGGQKQRLTIARAIAKNAPLLILDEATSALDSASEKIVQQALENLMRNRTSIVIAHRLSTILGADRILVMQDGRIEAEGTHRELLERSPLYSRLYAMQFKE
ncbi:MAG: ATP-binding cassette domain-containing protein [Deltaproteobacteria bacterium]|jgi:subfamily B ATP-binding cassette protein MsbA|nr:ATP-binding cassette domain-containing protein [Deltaproteobacteria bacterium]